MVVFSQRPVILKHYDHTLMYLEIFWDTVFSRGFQGRRPKAHNYVLWKIIFSYEHVWIACVGAIYYGKCNYVLINCIRHCVNIEFNQINKFVSTTKQQLLKMWHLRHRLRIISFHRKVVFCSQDIQFFVFLTIPWFNIFVMSWGVLITWDRIFEPHFIKSPTKFGELIYINRVNDFQESLEQYGGLGLSSRFFSI